MRFWDASALVPLLTSEPEYQGVGALLREDDSVALWWGTHVECLSAIWRKMRARDMEGLQFRSAVQVLGAIEAEALIIQPRPPVRDRAGQLLGNHALVAGDAFQLAAALDWAGGKPTGLAFVSLDRRLREAALKEGFQVLPE